MSQKVNVLGVLVDSCSLAEAVQNADAIIQAGIPKHHASVNLYQIALCREDEQMLNYTNRAGITIVESENVMRLAKRLNTPLEEKIDTMTYTIELCKLAARKGYGVFLLGGSPGAAEGAAKKLQELCPQLKIAGTYAPPYGFEKDEAELSKIVDMLKRSGAQILFVGLGSPKQDRFIETYCEAYNIPFSLAIGRMIDILSGQFLRSPQWVSKLGMEWLYRCFQDPKLFKRKYFSRGAKLIRCYFEQKHSQRKEARA